jgi:Flp pilus assembly CpaE family ATPase
MKVLWVAGETNIFVPPNIHKNKAEIINNGNLNIFEVNEYIDDEACHEINVIIVADDYLNYNLNDKTITEIKKLLARGYKTILFTRDFRMEKILKANACILDGIKVIIFDEVRIPFILVDNTIEQLLNTKNSDKLVNTQKSDIGGEEKKKSFIDRFKSKPKNIETVEATDKLTSEFKNIGKGISRVIAITGHRGSGLTSTVVNLAYEANKRGLSTIIVDLDLEYRSINMYFDKFSKNAQKDDDINASLIRTLARPQDYMSTAYNIKENLWLTTLGYNFNDKKLLNQFLTSNQLIALLSVLRHKFNVVLLDAPLDMLRDFSEILIHIDFFGLCVPNNLYSIVSTIRNIEVCLKNDTISYLNAKSKIIVTKYNDLSRYQKEIFTSNIVSDILTSGLNEFFTYELKVAGFVPYSSDFDSQIESDIPITNTNTQYEQNYGKILLRLMEGA